MEIYKDKALIVNTKNPNTIIASIPKSKVLKSYENGVSKKPTRKSGVRVIVVPQL